MMSMLTKSCFISPTKTGVPGGSPVFSARLGTYRLDFCLFLHMGYLTAFSLSVQHQDPIRGRTFPVRPVPAPVRKRKAPVQPSRVPLA